MRTLSFSIALFVSGCGVENPSSLTDTTGAEVGWDCAYGSCTTVIESWSPRVPSMCGEDTELLVGAGAIAILCGVSRGAEGSDVVHERTCRPIACGDDLDCPQWQERAYFCIESLCQADPPLALDRIDVTALCLWDVPRHESCTTAEEDAVVDTRIEAVDAACGETCTIPDGCLVP